MNTFIALLNVSQLCHKQIGFNFLNISRTVQLRCNSTENNTHSLTRRVSGAHSGCVYKYCIRESAERAGGPPNSANGLDRWNKLTDNNRKLVWMRLWAGIVSATVPRETNRPLSKHFNSSEVQKKKRSRRGFLEVMICIDVLYIDLNTTIFQHMPKATKREW